MNNFPLIAIIFLTIIIKQSTICELLSRQIVNDSSCKEASKYVSLKCEQFDEQIKSLLDFIEFYENFNKLNECLKSKHSFIDKKSLILAEEICEQKSILYPSVKTLGNLIESYKNSTQKSICTIEYAIKIYRLNNQLKSLVVDINDNYLLKILNFFAIKVVNRCEMSLSKRLSTIEKKAPDSVKFITVINGIMNIGGPDKIDKLPLEIEQYVPILHNEMLSDSMNSLSLSASGYEFKITKQIKMAIDSLKMSCNSLKAYQVNIFGSLGLLASVGYLPSIIRMSNSENNNNNNNKDSTSIIKRWLMSTILCQTIKTTLKMSEFSEDGKNLGFLKIVQIQEPDIDVEMENDIEFETYKLGELKSEPNYDLNETIKNNHNLTINRNRIEQINRRKLQLLEGPNFKLANAIYNYLDLTQKEKRIRIPYEILAIKMPDNLLDKNNEEDDDDDDDDE